MENEENVQKVDTANYFAMNDDDIMGMTGPVEPAAAAVPPADDAPPPADTDTPPPADDTPPPTDDVPPKDGDDDALPADDAPPADVPPVIPAEQGADKTASTGSAEATKDKDATPVIDYEAEYKKLMGPFKANGREIQLQSPEEGIKLMQMGANYTKKMQALQPVLRIAKMLENNQLMDEAQLSYLIDLHQKKPEAIQKLLADSKFDPLEADVEKAASYVPGDHRVSESEVQFESVLEDVQSTPTGNELISEVARQWDEDSKQALFRDPRLLMEINNQKAAGLYGRISGEIERRRMLGDLQGVPFLTAYETVGKELHAKGLLVPEAVATPAPAPVATRVAAPAAKVVNSDRARAAMPVKPTASSNKPADFNPLAVSDDAFLKQMEGRL